MENLRIYCFKVMLFNLFYPNVSFSCPLKTLDNIKNYNVFLAESKKGSDFRARLKHRLQSYKIYQIS